MGWINESTKVFSNGSAILKEWGMIVLLNGYMWVVALLGRPRKRWIDSVHDYLKKRSLNVGQTRKMAYDRNEWRGFLRRKCLGHNPGSLTRCYSCGMLQL